MDPASGQLTSNTGLNLRPIGVVHSALKSKVEAARQPAAATGATARIELYPGRHFEHALEDLEGWERIWILFWFHLNDSWRPKVLPPRSASGRKGVFATRSPYRPNPIGLSAVRLERIEGLTLHIRDVDLVDGTPVLDIKPYVPYTDAYPDSATGWLHDESLAARGATPADPITAWAVHFEPLAAEQAAWIEARTGLDLRARITATLMLGPQPHAYRRIRRDGADYRLKVKEWRVQFTLDRRDVRVLAISSGYRPAEIARSAGASEDPLAVHRDFRATW
ncbi:MAG: tRNA (N6-threonylcarbamoyladenosine(37)-N6)-methyltransferase TrmO [Gammaproteobacteria bacterium]|nr:tRNA (N6-threonylcarbamoyladenosine(37)-N6)-methyltransferase TrmO [Gammaproteobacteria bacterium]MDH5275099.1 tRNA (N6-threonylcarbamoyladenosine(37)-N6)-methyltransferase TrmO [Gammaproteobacteria bacterium]